MEAFPKWHSRPEQSSSSNEGLFNSPPRRELVLRTDLDLSLSVAANSCLVEKQ